MNVEQNAISKNKTKLFTLHRTSFTGQSSQQPTLIRDRFFGYKSCVQEVTFITFALYFEMTKCTEINNFNRLYFCSLPSFKLFCKILF